MKKKWIFIIALSVLSLETMAQIKVGFRAGVSSNSFRPQDKVRLLVTQGKVADDLQRANEAEFRYQQAKTATVISGNGYDGPIYSPAYTPAYIEQLRLATLNQRYYLSDQSVLGATVGGYVSMSVTSFLAGRAEVMYAISGGTMENYSIGGFTRTNVRAITHNLEFPVMAELSMPSMSESKVQPKVRLGVQYGVNLSAQEKFETRVNSPFGSQTEKDYASISSGFTTGYFGYLVGLGVDIEGLSIEFRYNHTLTSMESDSAPTSALQSTLNNYGGELRTSTFSINLSMPLFEF